MNRILVILSLCILSSCSVYNTIDCYDEEIIKKNISVESFKSIDVDFLCDILLVEGSEQKVEIEAKSDLIDDLEKFSEVTHDTWKLRIKNNCIFGSNNETKIIITTPYLESLKADSRATIVSKLKLNNLSKNFDIKADGNARIKLEVDNIENCNLILDGNAEIQLAGLCNKLTVKVDGSSELFAHDFQAKNCNIVVDGNSSANIYARDVLDVTVDGLGKVCYKGNPKLTSNRDGLGRVKDCN